MAVADDLIDAQAREDAYQQRDCVISLLQQAARTIDSMWRAAQSDGQNPPAVALGEASHGVHRAMIALQADATLDPESRSG
jgi:hypothetical protein